MALLRHLLLGNANRLRGAITCCNKGPPVQFKSKHVAHFSQSTFTATNCNKSFVRNVARKNDYLLSVIPDRFVNAPSRSMSAAADHSRVWVIEKAISVALIALIPLDIAYPNALFDNLLVLLTIPHVHWGIDNFVHDYIRVVVFGPVIPKIANVLVYVITSFLLGSLFYFNYNDIGIGKSIRKIWSVRTAKM